MPHLRCGHESRIAGRHGEYLYRGVLLSHVLSSRAAVTSGHYTDNKAPRYTHLHIVVMCRWGSQSQKGVPDCRYGWARYGKRSERLAGGALALAAASHRWGRNTVVRAQLALLGSLGFRVRELRGVMAAVPPSGIAR